VADPGDLSVSKYCIEVAAERLPRSFGQNGGLFDGADSAGREEVKTKIVYCMLVYVEKNGVNCW